MITEPTNGFDAYAMYNALRLHFTSPTYDYIKYHGKTNVSKDGFMRRKDKFSYYKLARKYYIEDLKNFYIANMVAGRTSYITEMLEPEATDTYLSWQKRVQALSYLFKNDLDTLFQYAPAELVKVKDGQVPLIVAMQMKNLISIETLVIINNLLNLFEVWDSKIQDDIIWPNVRMRCLKYTPFIEFDRSVYKKIFLEKVKEHT
jgi:hypothetical protein